MPSLGFHPVIEQWFGSRFKEPTEPQHLGWPRIAAGSHTLIAAPTGSGKTLTAFLAVIDRLLRDSLAGNLPDETRVVYVSPLRALSNDMHRNLEVPLQEIIELAEQNGLPTPNIRAGLRTGDTSPSKRAALIRKPAHILVTTPESLYLMLTGARARETLRTVEVVIVDEIHAMVRDKRGSHLSLTLERLEALCGHRLQRIGLSATQKPIERISDFLLGDRLANGDETCAIVDVGHARTLDLAVEVPASELGAVCTHEQWAEVNARIVELINEHRSTLIFVNTRRLAERVTHQLSELLGDACVGTHHGSLSAKTRLETEHRLKCGELKAVVATASLELGLDIGYIDQVIQIGSPRSIAAFLQRVGRSGHSLGLVPKGRLFALTRDELLECAALVRAVRAGRLDSAIIPEAPLDILAQQIVAEVSAQEWSADDMFAMVRRSDAYRKLPRKDFDEILDLLSEGISRSSGRSRVHLHYDRVQGRLRARRGARIMAATNGGAIAEIASFRVVAEPDETVVGTLDEEFATESQSGDIFLLGNTSWRILHVRGGEVRAADAHGAPPTVPFWRGEAPGRTLELSYEVSLLREELEVRCAEPESAQDWLVAESHIPAHAAAQIVEYVAAQKAAIGLVPTMKRIVFERFFDETGGMQLVIHSPYGSRINKAWGLAMRKRFCRSFDFELQATADDNGIILSLGPQHSFPLASMFTMLNVENTEHLLEQAILQTPMFPLRWRWNVTRSLLVSRMQNGKRVPPALQRFRADDLLSAVFPQATACLEHIVGDTEIPDHPLVRQTVADCLTEAMDIDGLKRVIGEIERGEITLVPRDTREPSPFSYQLLNANPYAFLDGGEAQERRTRAVATRRSVTVESVRDLGRLDPEAIAMVCREAMPEVRSADELHDALLSRLVLPVEETADWQDWFVELDESGRATMATLPDGHRFWVAAERIPAVTATYPELTFDKPLAVPAGVRTEWSGVDARTAIVRGLVEVCGPTTSEAIANRVGLTVSQVDACLEALEGEGIVLRGEFTPRDESGEVAEIYGTGVPPATSACTSSTPSSNTPDSNQDLSDGHAGGTPAPQSQESKRPVEWCHRRLLARIHRLTMEGLRRQIQPVRVAEFIRFLARHHGFSATEQRAGSNGVFDVLAMLQGIDIPCVAWERDILPARLGCYKPEWLDELCFSGEVGWGRLAPRKSDPNRARPMASLTRVAPVSLFLRSDLKWLTRGSVDIAAQQLSSPASEILQILQQRGAVFAADLLSETRMLPTQLDDVLGELVSAGILSADGFGGLRQLLGERSDSARKHGRRDRSRAIRRRAQVKSTVGRWSIWRRIDESDEPTDEAQERERIEQWAWQLLRRWGVVFRDLLTREQATPSWFELLQVYRRLEARGEIRGGRFIAGVGGEQFALGDTVRQLRAIRDEGPREELLIVSAADPLNLVGILTKQARVPSTASNYVIYLDGLPVAAYQTGEVQYFQEVTGPARTLIEHRFARIVSHPPVGATTVGKTVEAVTEELQKHEPTSRRLRPPAPPGGIPRPMIS